MKGRCFGGGGGAYLGSCTGRASREAVAFAKQPIKANRATSTPKIAANFISIFFVILLLVYLTDELFRKLCLNLR